MEYNEYGYKVCYQELNSSKLKVHLCTNSYSLAKFELNYYKTHPQRDRQTNKLLIKPQWYIYPVRSYFEYSILWRGCPFRDYLSDFIKRRKQWLN